MPDTNATMYKKATQDAVDHLIQPWPSAGSIGAESRGMLGSGEGVYVHDEKGRKLIDGPAGMWCTNVGHRNEILADTLKQQAMELVCGKPGCTVHVVKEERTPFSQSYGFQESRQSQRLIEIKCARQFVLLGAYECQNMSPATH